MNVLHDGLGESEIPAVPVTSPHGRGGQLGRKSGQGFYTY